MDEKQLEEVHSQIFFCFGHTMRDPNYKEEHEMPTGMIQSKSLSILQDQLTHEFIACKKAERYAESFQDASLKQLASELANCHRVRYNRLFDYLNSWQ